MTEIKLLPIMQKRYDEIVQGYIHEEVISTEEDARGVLQSLTETELGQKLVNKFGSLDEEWPQQFLLDALRDEIGRGLLNPVYKVYANVHMFRVWDSPIVDENREPTGKTVRRAKATASVVIVHKNGNKNKPQIADISGEKEFADVLEDAITEGVTYELEAATNNAEGKYLFLKVDDRCTSKIKKSDFDVPHIESVARTLFEKMPIHKAKELKSKGGFDHRMVEGRVVDHPTMRNNQNAVRVLLSDASVTTEDIGKDGQNAYLTVMVPPEQITFGKDSIAIFIGEVSHNNENFGATMWRPRAIIPLIEFELKETFTRKQTSTSKSKPQNAASIIANIQERTDGSKSIAETLKSKPTKESEPESEPKPMSKMTIPKEPEPEPESEPEPEPEPKEESTQTRRSFTPSKTTEEQEQAFLTECSAWGDHKPGDVGCEGCFKEWEDGGKDPNHIYPACVAKSEVEK